MNRKIVLSAFVSVLLLSTVFGTIWLSGLITSATSTTWTVDDDRIQCPGADFWGTGSIQKAIDRAKPGDTIEVYPGDYYESIVIDKSIDLIGVDGSYVTTIDAGFTTEFQVINIKSSNVRVENFSIMHCWEGEKYGAGIRLQSGPESDLMYGIVIHNNNISNLQIGIDSSHVHLIDSKITENAILFTRVKGIDLSDCTKLNLSRNIIEVASDFAIHIENSNYGEISRNNVSYTKHGLELENGIENNITGNRFTETNVWGIIVGGSYNNVGGNDFTGYNSIFMKGNLSRIYNNTVKSEGGSFGFSVMGFHNDIDSNIIIGGLEYGIWSRKPLNNFTNNIVQNANTGIYNVSYSSGNEIQNCSIGIHIPSTKSNVTIFNNDFHNCEQGVRVEGNFSNINSNTFVNNYATNGIILCGCYNNVTRNLFLRSNCSICLLSASFNNITENTISSSVRFIDSYNSQNNRLCHNDVFNVTSYPCCEEASTNEYMCNYWDDYCDYGGIDDNGDGYGDIRYRVATTETYDNSPRNVPYGSFPILWRDIEFHCRVLGNLVVSNICFDHSSGCLQFKIAVSDSAESPSRFNRLIIPRRILDGHFKVVIDDTVIPSILSWNDTYTSIYFTYIEKGIHNVKIIGEIVTKVPITEITEFPDINRDGVVNILDVAAAALPFGKTLEEYYGTKKQQD